MLVERKESEIESPHESFRYGTELKIIFERRQLMCHNLDYSKTERETYLLGLNAT